VLFNSCSFIFVYLPIVALAFYLLGRSTRSSALLWITVASLVFYAWWRPVNVLLIAPSILVNYVLAKWMQRLVEREDRRATLLLVLGILFNVLVLGYFKYRNFFAESVNFAFGTSLPMAELLLPLGISFITFQKIAFLVDVHGGRVNAFSLRDYFLFVLFFPQLIAGPIVHYTEVMPQFRQATCRFQAADVAQGLTLFVFGLFKKVVLADSIAPLVSMLFLRAAGGEELSLVPAWMVAIGYTLQLYFDFSGYSDMALGLARIFGIRLPANFNSPLRATNIIDFWRRWHITLTRFLTAYIYNPLVLRLTRKRIAAGRPVSGGAGFALGPYLVLVAGPTMLVMLVSGIWHGAGFKFVVWGLLHGIFLCCNHAWRQLSIVKAWRKGGRYDTIMAPVGFLLTFVSVVVAMVFFGAPSTAAAVHVLKEMVGAGGVGLPVELFARLGGAADALRNLGIGETASMHTGEFVKLAGLIAGLLALALASPNSLEVLGWDESASPGAKTSPGARILGIMPIRWQSSAVWAGVVAVLAVVVIGKLGGPSEFLYWQF
jgi:alginate O-acetyltransferase complex protein AlgI